MKKSELKCALRAAAALAGEAEFYIVGTQAVHAYCSRPPAEVLISQECDLYPRTRPQAGPLLEAELGRGSEFAREHGFYVDVVTPEIATLPPGWESRLKNLPVGKVTGWCLEMHDLIVSKLAAGRLKDLEFVGALLKLSMVDRRILRQRISWLHLARDRARVRSRLAAVLNDLIRRE